MIDTTTSEQLTSHSEMLANARQALSALLADLQTQQGSCDALLAISARQGEDLAAHQQRRSELLSALQIAQLAANKAEAAKDLAVDTPRAHKREMAYEAAKNAVNELHAQMLALASADAQLREEMQGSQTVLADAQENLQRIQERAAIAASLVAEEEEMHRQEVASAYQSKVDSARQERDRLKALLAEAETKVQSAQSDQVEALKVWPQFAEQELDKTLEIAPSLAEQLLDLYLRYASEIEEHSQGLVKADPAVLRALLVPCPVHVFSAAGPREAQRAAYARNYKSPGRGITPELWHFDTHLGETEQLRDRRRQEHRQAVIHDLVWGNQ